MPRDRRRSAGRGARLQIPPPRSGIAHRDARYALRLSGAEIRGSIDLMGEFTAIGGIALDTAHVRGDVVARGARIGAGEGDAIGAQAARFDGVVILADGFVAAGVIWLMGARIAGTLDMNAARLVNRSDDGQGVVLAADTAEIGGSVLLRNGFAADGAISLRGARIGSSLECDGASMTNPMAGWQRRRACRRPCGDRRRRAAAQRLRRARCGRPDRCEDRRQPRMRRRQPDQRHADGTGVALAAENAVIGGAVLLRHGCNAQGGVSLLGATIGSNVECCGALLENWSESGSRETLRLTNVAIAGDVLLNQGFTSIGYVSLWGTKIGRDLDCSGATFIGASAGGAGRSSAGAMVATNLAVAGDVKLIDVTVLGRLDCEHLETGGSLIWDGLRFPREITRGETRYRYHAGLDAPPRLLLAHARIGAALLARDLTAEVELSIDLGGARAARWMTMAFPPVGVSAGRSTACSAPSIWMVSSTTASAICRPAKAAGSASCCRRLAAGRRSRTAAVPPPGRIRLARRMIHEQRVHVRQRLGWVGRQQRKVNEFHPQPSAISRRCCVPRATTTRRVRWRSSSNGSRPRPTGCRGCCVRSGGCASASASRRAGPR